MAVSFSKNQDDITRAWKNVVENKDDENWAIFGYEGSQNIIKLMSTGSNGLDELVKELNCSLIQYAFCRVIDNQLGLNKLVLINWQGESAPLSRKGLCASHVNDVANYFKGCTQTITIRNDDEANREYLTSQIFKTSSSRISVVKNSNDNTQNLPVSSTYKRTDIGSEIPQDRKSFWQRQEEEERERLAEEKKKAAERQAQFDRERKEKEESEAKKLADTIKERDRLIEATRKAETRSSTNNRQPNSLSSVCHDEDDERVGRRSELIRLERNQETNSLITKGLIKSKRALFEQSTSQDQKGPSNQAGTNLTRRSSGTLVSQRLNAFKSFVKSDNSTNASADDRTNGITTNVELSGDNPEKTNVNSIRKQIESIKLTNDESDICVMNDSPSKPTKNEVNNQDSTSPNTVAQNGNGKKSKTDESENNNHIVDEAKSPEIPTEASRVNGVGTKAKALFDYQATDDTEISFDPDDIIGYITKVDVGWWHGSVVTGRFKGQVGLFPANYVEELTF